MSTIAAGTTSGTALVSTGNTSGELQLQVNGTTPSVTLAANGSIGVGSSPSYGTNGQLLTSSGTGSAPTWTTISSSPTIVRSARTSDTILGTADVSKLIDITSGTFSQTFTAAATLGSGWFCYIQNSGTGYITLDPNASETITRNGVAHTTWVLWPQEAALIVCNGTGFFYTNLQKGQIVQTLATQASVAFATGVAYRTKMNMTIEGISVDTSAVLSVKLNTSTDASRTAQFLIRSNGTNVSATTNNFNYINNTNAAWDVNQTGDDRMFGQIDIGFGSIGTMLNGWAQRVSFGAIYEYQYHAGFFGSINSTNVTSLGLYLASGNLTGGTITVTEL